MSQVNQLVFPNGRSVSQTKKDARRLKNQSNISLTEALNQCARNNGIDLNWDKAIEALKEAQSIPASSLSRLLLEEDLAMQSHFRPSDNFYDLLEKTRVYPPKSNYPSLRVDLSSLPQHVYQTLMAHPSYRKHIESFLKLNDFNLEILHPNSDARNDGDNWNIKVRYDGYSENSLELGNNRWVAFRNWLTRFSRSTRIDISERMKEPGYVHYACQSFYNKTDYANQLESDVDRALFYQMCHKDINFRELKWRLVDFSVLGDDVADNFSEAKVVARFDYQTVKESDIMFSDSIWSSCEYPLSVRVAQLYVSAIADLMKQLSEPELGIESKLVELNTGKPLAISR